jgi:hypothetical protein
MANWGEPTDAGLTHQGYVDNLYERKLLQKVEGFHGMALVYKRRKRDESNSVEFVIKVLVAQNGNTNCSHIYIEYIQNNVNLKRTWPNQTVFSNLNTP